MQLNTHIGRRDPIEFLLEIFPLVASLWELSDAVLETVAMSYIYDGTTIIHIPLYYILKIVGLTALQYTLAFVIARISGWSKHSVNAVLEVALLTYYVFK